MAIAPLLSSLTVVLATRAMLTPVGRSRTTWVRLVIAVAIQALLAAAPIVDSANWWIIAAVILVIDIMHLLLISLIKDEHLPQLLSFILTVIAISATLGAPGLVPRYNSLAAHAAYEVVRSNTMLSSISPQVFQFMLVTLCGLWIAGVEVNHPIAFVLRRFKLMPVETRKRWGRVLPEPARGRMIGILERMIVFILTITGNLSGLGLVLAAKAFARFKDLDRRDFAEYVLIGTLMSISGALLVGLLLKPLI